MHERMSQPDQVLDEGALSGSRPHVRFEGLSVYFGPRAVVKSVSLVIPRHRVTAIVGPSGSGKTALLRALNRMNESEGRCRTEGRLLVDNRNVYDADVDVYDLRRRVGLVGPEPSVFPQSILDNVAFGPRLHGTAGGALLSEAVEESLTRAGLWEEVRNRLTDSAMRLLPGQQQQLCIARCLALRPEVLLLDESTAMLDAVARARIEQVLGDLRAVCTVVLATHDVAQAARVSDQTVFMEFGEVVEAGETGQLFTNPREKRTEAYLSGRHGA